MKKNILLIMLMGIFLVPLFVSGDVVQTSTGFIWTNISFDNRTLIDWDFYIPNESICSTCDNTVVLSNLERKEVFAVFKIIPNPADSCFYNNTNCPSGNYDTNIGVNYSRPAYISSWWGGHKYTSNWGGGVVDTSSCWNWWNSTDDELRNAQKRSCPTIVIKIDEEAEACNIFWQTDSPGSAFPDYTVRFLGFSSNEENIDNKISSPILGFMTALTGFMDVSVDIWKVGYYVFAIIMILAGLGLVIGVFPLGLRWVVKKILSKD